ncbi:MAG: ribbon-helix-helix domain-containing protein [Rhodospirillaceae bacterium]|jgi:predicted DNA-binding ribbon-helix-helix protein|nr:ribbon-helix-helix domain-containing protein [Rhodospirillaceae bacterium]
MGAIVKRSVSIAGHPTSVSLEQEFWDALKDIAKSHGQSVQDLVSTVDKTRDGGLSSALRVYVLQSMQNNQRPPD